MHLSGRQVRRRRPGVSLRLGPSFVRQRSSINDNGDRLAAAWKGIDRRRRDFIPRRALNILRRQVSHSTPACVCYLPTRRSSIACPRLCCPISCDTPRGALSSLSLSHSLPISLSLSLLLTSSCCIFLPSFTDTFPPRARPMHANEPKGKELGASLAVGLIRGSIDLMFMHRDVCTIREDFPSPFPRTLYAPISSFILLDLLAGRRTRRGGPAT